MVGDDAPRPAEDRDSLYAGIAGLAPVLAELGRHREHDGIAAFLLRLARVLEDGPTAAVVDRPDQWWTVPERLCVTRAR